MSKKTILHIFGNMSAFLSVILSLTLSMEKDSLSAFIAGMFVFPVIRVFLMHRKNLSEFFKMVIICEIICIVSFTLILYGLFDDYYYFYFVFLLSFVPVFVGDAIAFALTYEEKSYEMLESHTAKKNMHEKKLAKLEKFQSIASVIFIILNIVLFIVNIAVGVF